MKELNWMQTRASAYFRRRVGHRSLLALVLSLGACLYEGAPPEYEEFFKLPLAQQHREIDNYPFDKQIEIYLVAVQRIHPPDYGFADDIASHGEVAVPFLVERLNNEQSEFTQQHIIYVFQMMAEFHSWGVEHDLYIEYDVKSDQEVVSLVEELVSSMQEPLPRQRGEEALGVILGR